MSEAEQCDAIIVGAGPAGLACAIELARKGREVVVLERGASCGEKNLTGGRLYTHALKKLGLLDQAIADKALERPVTIEQIMLLADGSGLTIDFADKYQRSDDIPQTSSWTVLHSRFNAWLAQQAEKAGATIACGVRVDRLIEQDGKTVGVQAGDEELFAKTVVAADGVNSLLAAQSGLDAHVNSHSVGVGIKEVLELPREAIEQRFLTGPNSGAARVILGGTGGISGGGAIYTNRDSVSVVVVFNPAQAAAQAQTLPDIFQDFRSDPALAPLLADGKTIEYGAHLVMENGWQNAMQKPWKPGLLVVGEAAGYVINTGLIIRGIDLAILSGMAAAEAILADCEDTGAKYGECLAGSGLLKALQDAQKWPDFMKSPYLPKSYPEMANDIFRQLFKVNDEALPLKKRLWQSVRNADISIFKMLGDIWRAYRAL